MIAGLTGGIGSGKSTVSRIFEILGCAVFNSDNAAKLVYFEAEVRNAVQRLLGKESYLSNNQIDKNYISTKVFNDTTLLHSLNQIIHPAVGKLFTEFVKQNPGRVIIKETALLFEAHLEKHVNKIIMVESPDELRIKRVMKRDDLSEAEIIKRIKSQLPQEEKIKRSDFVIHNNETELLIPQVISVFLQLR